MRRARPAVPIQALCPVPARRRVVLGDGNDDVMLCERCHRSPCRFSAQAGNHVLEAIADATSAWCSTAVTAPTPSPGTRSQTPCRVARGDYVLSGGDAATRRAAARETTRSSPTPGSTCKATTSSTAGPGFDRVHDWGSTLTLPGSAVVISVYGAVGDGRPGESDNVTARRALRRRHPRALCPRRQRRQHRPPEPRQLVRRRKRGRRHRSRQRRQRYSSTAAPATTGSRAASATTRSTAAPAVTRSSATRPSSAAPTVTRARSSVR